MTSDDLHYSLDLRRTDLDPELIAAAVAVHSMRRLIAAGGGSVERPDEEEALSPHHLEAFLVRAVETAKRTRRFEQEWRRMHQLVPQIQVAWERGQVLFQEDLARAMTNPEEMEYLSMIDFAEDCYAEVRARRTYPHDPVQQAWATSGYMLAWWQHFLAEEDASL
jgi:shikimate kinase